MTFIAVQCPHCHSEQMVKRGKTRRGTQRSLCQNMACAKGSFLLDYRNNASGIRDIARVLRVSTDTVLSELRKKGWCSKSGDIPLAYVYKYLFLKQ
jgi:transposase-like protein